MRKILELLQSILYFTYHSCIASCYTAAVNGYYDKDDYEVSLELFCEDLDVKESIYLDTLEKLCAKDK